jgi:hypothetical protein
MSPDAQVRIEDVVRKEFYSYMNIAKSNPVAFGIDSSKLYYKVKGIIEDNPLEFQRLNGNAILIDFDEPKSDNTISISRIEGDSDFQFLINRKYNDLGRVFGVGLASFIKSCGSDFSVYFTSSELCRGIEERADKGCIGESVNDLQLTVINSDSDYCLSIKNHYALENRHANLGIIHAIMGDVKGYISNLKDGFADVRELHRIVGRDSEERGIIFHEGLKNLQNGELGFEVKNNGFKVWYPGKNGVSAPWREVYFHTDYEKAEIADIENFRKLFEETAYTVLKKKSGIKTKLEVVSRLVDNKKKFERVYPARSY